MKITFIGHASILVETKGVSILSDPWWQGPCFGAQWWLHPHAWLEPVEARPPDFIYVSHGHSDHLHHATLRRLPQSAKVVVSDALDIAGPIRDLGFDVIELPEKTPTEIAPGVEIEITPTMGGDTYMVVRDGDETCFNFNDAVHATPDDYRTRCIADLLSRYGKPDYLFCGYGTASHFPNCYVVPDMDAEATAKKRQAHFNRVWARIAAAAGPRFAFPFAADLVFFDDDLMWANEPIHNPDRPTDVYRRDHPGSDTTVIDLAPGFCIENGTIVRENLFRPVSNEMLRAERPRDIAAANQFSDPERSQVEELAGLVRRNVGICLDYLRERRRDYRFLLALKGGDAAIEIAKSGNAVEVSVVDAPFDEAGYDIVFTTRFSYLRRALTTQYGHEGIFVGSGGIFAYRDRATADQNLHQELWVLLTNVEEPPTSRFGDQPEWLYRIKTGIKRLLGQKPSTLYDLGEWIVYKS
jgi:hypothetical protein